jgi:hypothetical protein
MDSSKFKCIERPKKSTWKCKLFGMENTLIVHPAEGEEPNWFWRWMQYICFGNKWVKDK